MSPRFSPDLTKARASIRIFDRGDYELAITGVKPISYTKDDGKEVAGGRILFEMVGRRRADGTLDREFEGETVTPLRLYVHTEDAWGMTKRFFMAALGYKLDDEGKFDEEWASQADISVDGEGDEAILGKSWEEVVGQHVISTLTKRWYEPEDGSEKREQQDLGSFLPVSS